MGGLAALWGQVAAGMAGLSPDWLTLIGASPAMAGIAQRYGQADSLETLKLILEPIAPNTNLLLYHLLQVVAWAVVGGLVGLLADRAWIQQRRPWGAILAAAAGALSLLGAHAGLGVWLEQYTPEALRRMAAPLLATTALVAVVAGALEGLRDFLEHPLPPGRPHSGRRARIGRASRARARAGRAEEDKEAGRSPLPVPADFPHWEPADESEDLIMLELD
jgi:hypothetical protein